MTVTLEEAISKRVDVADIDAENKLTTVMPIELKFERLKFLKQDIG